MELLIDLHLCQFSSKIRFWLRYDELHKKLGARLLNIISYRIYVHRSRPEGCIHGCVSCAANTMPKASSIGTPLSRHRTVSLAELLQILLQISLQPLPPLNNTGLNYAFTAVEFWDPYQLTSRESTKKALSASALPFSKIDPGHLEITQFSTGAINNSTPFVKMIDVSALRRLPRQCARAKPFRKTPYYEGP